jgi:hypothetical protein
MTKTAVEWLLARINDEYLYKYYSKDIEQAKEMEKQQIIDAYLDGNYDNGMGRCEELKYYNETFKNK